MHNPTWVKAGDRRGTIKGVFSPNVKKMKKMKKMRKIKKIR